MDLSGTQRAPDGGAASVHLLEHVEQWLSRRWVPIVINLLALALLSFSLARGTWRLLTPPVTDNPSAGVPASENSGDYNLQSLLSSNLFGQLTSTAKGAESVEDVPISSLNLVLTGVMITPAGGFALISADGSPELPFSVGQEIVGGVSLYAVYSDRALIRRGSATESLMLKDIGTLLPDGSIVMPNPAVSPKSRKRDRIRQQGIQQQSTNNFMVDREQLTQQMQTPEFLTQALMVPNAGGGFLVREINPGSIYEKLGLRVGDVINAVNGQNVNTVDDVMRLYQQFGTAGNIQVNVRRSGKNETIVYNIQ
jgi:general secretion pathway protein C